MTESVTLPAAVPTGSQVLREFITYDETQHLWTGCPTPDFRSSTYGTR